MRVVLVGSTGNIGTSLLRRFQQEAEPPQLVGLARRLPDTSEHPYRGVEWRQVNIADEESVPELIDAFTGADAVVHLAWKLQPNRDEREMWQTNVRGTARVLRAVAAARVPHLVYLSSIAAYSPGPRRRRVGEDWPTGGIHTSHYSRQKAVNERVVDKFEAEHPDIVVTRIRPGLVFQRGAGAQEARIFVGTLLPLGWLNTVRPPIVPLPRTMWTQDVHASDVADALFRVIDRRAGGAFNLAAEPVLTPERIASVVGGRWVRIRFAAARAFVSATWKLRLHATDPGWLDIAANSPMMSTERARRVLGWEPKVSSVDALAEILSGAADRAGMAGSPPLEVPYEPIEKPRYTRVSGAETYPEGA
ncbi:NAD-dependent epimerase/dehydratase family protein [Lysobacter korlensis]|uniref:NAD-dependent epimerase/dehydratase family protein n=1 Tax=Lysobacter korlensis TaxID=553636 RepID=A0ABV6RZ75_9GAMM